MTEGEKGGTRPSDVTRLLMKAVRALPEEEQLTVFAYFFERAIGVPQPPLFRQFVHEDADYRAPRLHPEVGEERVVAPPTVQKGSRGPQVTIPVRLSEAQHQRLKAWSAEHDFPMAVVVRGLLERFLDGWDKRAA